MRKRGFTLVEMLAVVIILGLLIIVAIPQIQNQLLSKKEAVNEATLALIYEATESFVDAYPSRFQKMYISETDHASYCITIKDLVEAGKLEAPIKDYSTGEDMDLNTFIEINSNEYDEFVYELKESECSEMATSVILYKEELLKGNDPKLSDGMIPVVYVNGTWVKADIYDTWYRYGEKHWANAVTVNEKPSSCGEDCIDSIKKHSRSGYEKAIAGTKISMDDINGMYVWIPKYSYQINTASNPKSFKIEFEEKDGYTTHSAFGLNTGMWVAKFEASPKAKSLCDIEYTLENCNKSTVRITTTPNKNSLRNISLINAYTASQNIASLEDEYGMDNDKVGTHLMKNSEWGAVAYLTNSVYGKGTEIYVNKYYDSTNQKSRTGCTSGGAGTGKSNTCIAYDHENSKSGTTTGNIYGIYDMSGGAWEFVMGNYNYKTSLSGFSTLDTKYVNIYSAESTSGCDETGCPGSALSSTKNWFDDEYSVSFNDTNSWLIRGGYWDASDSKLLGIFAADDATGEASPRIGFRPVILVK